MIRPLLLAAAAMLAAPGFAQQSTPVPARPPAAPPPAQDSLEQPASGAETAQARTPADDAPTIPATAKPTPTPTPGPTPGSRTRPTSRPN